MNPVRFIRDHDEFIAGREYTVGSSDLPIILGLNKFKTARELWTQKLEGGEFGGQADSARWGHWLEPLIIREAIRRERGEKEAHKFYVDTILHDEFRGEKYKPPTDYWPYTESHVPEFPWATSHADCLYRGPGKPFIGEAKSGGYFSRVARDEKPGFDLDDETEAGLPLDIRIQIEWQFLTYDVDDGFVWLLIDDNEFHQWQVKSRRELWPQMIEAASKFMYCLKTKKTPPPMTKSDVFSIFPEAQEQNAYIVGEQAVLAEAMRDQRKANKARIKKLETVNEDIENALMLLHGDNKYLYNGDTAKVISKQVYSPGQLSPLHPSTILKDAPDAHAILVERGLVKTHDKRYLS